MAKTKKTEVAMANPTPGPWAAVESGSVTKGAHDFAVYAKRAFAKDVYIGNLNEGSDDPDLQERGWLPMAEARANAALAAAAPDLYEALEELLSADPRMNSYQSTLEKAEAALKKAKTPPGER